MKSTKMGILKMLNHPAEVGSRQAPQHGFETQLFLTNEPNIPVPHNNISKCSTGMFSVVLLRAIPATLLSLKSTLDCKRTML